MTGFRKDATLANPMTSVWSRSVARGASALLLTALALAASPARAADAIKGGQLYGMHCAACHGPAGISVMPGAPDFARQERLLQPDLALLANIRAGKNAMPAFQAILRDNDILDIIAFIRTLR